MGFTEVLTIVFIVLKLMNIISWSWFFVLLPEIIAFVIYILVMVIIVITAIKGSKGTRKRFDRF